MGEKLLLQVILRLQERSKEGTYQNIEKFYKVDVGVCNNIEVGISKLIRFLVHRKLFTATILQYNLQGSNNGVYNKWFTATILH